MRRRADVDPACPRFPGQDEVPGEGGAGFDLDHVSRPGGIEGGLEIAAGAHGDELASRGRRVRGVEEDPRQLGFGLGEGSGGQQRVVETNAMKKVSRARRAGDPGPKTMVVSVLTSTLPKTRSRQTSHPASRMSQLRKSSSGKWHRGGRACAWQP